MRHVGEMRVGRAAKVRILPPQPSAGEPPNPLSNSEMSTQIIPLKARADSQDPSRIAARETTRV
jgi:hypothetical protein